MSATYSAGVILGVKLIDIGFKAEFIKTPYKVHDKKGKPTGEIDTEYTWKFNYQGKETIDEGQQLYNETIEEIIDLKKPFEIFNINNYYADSDIDKVVVGINISNRSWDDYHHLEEINPDDKFQLVKDELKKQFGIDVEPKLYFFAEVS